MILLKRNSAEGNMQKKISNVTALGDSSIDQTIIQSESSEDNDMCLVQPMSISSISKDDVNIIENIFFFHLIPHNIIYFLN